MQHPKLGSDHRSRLFHPLPHLPPFQVVYQEGIFVRSQPNIETSRIVGIAPLGAVLKATGKVSVDVLFAFL